MIKSITKRFVPSILNSQSSILSKPTAKPLLIIALLSLSWGISYAINKYAMTHGVALWNYAFWMALGPAIVLLIVSRLQNIRFGISFQHGRYYLLAALLGIIIPHVTLYFVAPHLPAGILAMIVNTVPLLIFPLALVAGLERFSPRRFLGFMFGVLGVALVMIPSVHTASIKITHWLLLALIPPLCYATCTVYIAKYRPVNSHSLSLSAGMLLVASFLLFPLAFHSLHWIFYPLTRVGYLVILNILLSSIGYVLIFELIYLAGPICYSVVNMATVLAALFWGWLFFSEPLSARTLLAMLLIFPAIYWVSIHEKRLPPAM